MPLLSFPGNVILGAMEESLCRQVCDQHHTLLSPTVCSLTNNSKKTHVLYAIKPRRSQLFQHAHSSPQSTLDPHTKEEQRLSDGLTAWWFLLSHMLQGRELQGFRSANTQHLLDSTPCPTFGCSPQQIGLLNYTPNASTQILSKSFRTEPLILQLTSSLKKAASLCCSE